MHHNLKSGRDYRQISQTEFDDYFNSERQTEFKEGEAELDLDISGMLDILDDV